jgi:hypothetical protein
MAVIDVRCTAGHLEEVYRPAEDWPATPPCPHDDCGAPTEQVHLPPHVRWRPDPVVVFRAPDGSFRFPGDTNGPGVGKYDRMGYERIEVRSATEMRSLERRMNAQERSTASRVFERQQQAMEASVAERRRDLFDAMGHMSTFGREAARAAIARSESRRRRGVSDAGLYSEVYAWNRSNRDEARDPDGRRRRD